MDYRLRFLKYSERSILIEWPAIIDEIILQDILLFKKRIEEGYVKDIVEVVSTYNSILIIYNYTIDNINGAFFSLKMLYDSKKDTRLDGTNIYYIPVCYDSDFGHDLEPLSTQKNLTMSELVQLHAQPFYTVFFIGFLPGFLYLGGLHPKLHFDRKTAPDPKVKKGSVAIGGKQTGIYPQDSSGGWHIIGNSPVSFFDPTQNPPCFIKAGDKLKFKPISKTEYYKIQNKIENPRFNLKVYLSNG